MVPINEEGVIYHDINVGCEVSFDLIFPIFKVKVLHWDEAGFDLLKLHILWIQLPYLLQFWLSHPLIFHERGENPQKNEKNLGFKPWVAPIGFKRTLWRFD